VTMAKLRKLLGFQTANSHFDYITSTHDSWNATFIKNKEQAL